MYIGVDVRGTKIAVGFVSERGQLSFQSSLPVDPVRDGETVLLDIIYIVKSISETVPLDLFNDKLLGLGIAVEGSIDKSTGRITGCANPKMDNIPLQQIIERYFGIPVFVESSTVAAALAENELKTPKGSDAGIIAAGLLCKYLK